MKPIVFRGRSIYCRWYLPAHYSRCPGIGMLAVADNYNSPLQVDRQGTSVTGHFQYMGYSGRRVKASAYPVSKTRR